MSESTSPRTTETPKDDAGREKQIREAVAYARHVQNRVRPPMTFDHDEVGFLLSLIDDLRDQLTHAASTFASNDEATCLTEAANRRGGETP